MGTNFYFDEAKMTAWKSLPKTEFMRLFPAVTEQQIINTARMELHNTNLSTAVINKSEHNTEIFSKSY
jgi:predicted Zn-dependent peptidase